MSRKSTNLKRTSILVVLAFTMSLLMAFPAMAAGVGLTLDGQGNDVRKTFDVGENVNIATDVWCDIWVKQDGQYAWEGVSGPGQDVVLENVEAGAYVVDAIARDIDATARSVFFVDSAVDFTAKYENGEVTVTAEATNITDPYFQFWKATAGQNDWVAFGNPDAEGNEGYYGTDNTQSFTAEEGTYEIAVYAKDLNGRSQWQDAVAASAEFVAEPELLKVESVSAINDINVEYGTALGAVGLPDTVTITLSDDSTIDVEVSWDIESANYDGNVTGTYTFYGTISLPENINNPDNLIASVNVIVPEDPQIAIVEAAEEAVAAYEAATLNTLEEVAVAEELEAAANEAIALVADADVMAAFEARITAKKALVDTAKAQLEAIVATTDAVETAENSLLEADLAAAQEMVTALHDCDEKILLQARIDSVQLKINDIVDTVNNATTQVELYNALNVKPFVNVNVDLIASYEAAINAAKPTDKDTIAEIQAIIDGVNTTNTNNEIQLLVQTAKNAMTAVSADPDGENAEGVTLIDVAQEAINALPAELPEAVATAENVEVDYKADAQAELDALRAVAPVLQATNQVELLNALQSSYFVRVNAELIADYDTALDGTEITVDAIQADIDAVNLTAAQAAVGNAEKSLDADDVEVAQELVSALPEDVDPDTTKADLQERIDVVNGLIAIANATTEAELLAALQSEVLALTDVNEAAIAEYKTLVDGGADISTATNVQSNVIDAGNNNVLNDAVGAIENNFPTYTATDANDQAAALDELNRLADVSGDVDGATIVDANIEAYITDITTNIGTWAGDGITTSVQKAQAIQAVVNTVNDAANEAARLAAVNDAATAAEMKAALDEVAVAENTTAYINLSSVGKLEVAELVLAARPDVGFADTTAVTAEITNNISIRSTMISNVNNAATISDMDVALESLAYAPYDDLSAITQVAVAEAFLNAFPTDESGTRVNYTTLTDIKADVDAAISADQ